MFKEECDLPRGAAFEVYDQLGHGKAEEVYRQSLEPDLHLRRISFVSMPELRVVDKFAGRRARSRPELIVCGEKSLNSNL